MDVVSFKPHWRHRGRERGERQSADVGADLLLEERGVSRDAYCQRGRYTFLLSVSVRALLTHQFLSYFYLHFVVGGGRSGNKFGVDAGDTVLSG